MWYKGLFCAIIYKFFFFFYNNGCLVKFFNILIKIKIIIQIPKIYREESSISNINN